MAKIPVKPFVEVAIKHGPKVGKFVLKNAGKVAPVVGAAKVIVDAVNKKKDDDITQGRVHHRKARHEIYKKEVLPNLETKNRAELFAYRNEINQFIKQIEAEQAKELAVKKSLHTKRTKNWEAILLQIEDKINLNDFQEYLSSYNNPDYKSAYFNGFETTISKFKSIIEIGNVEEVRDFVITNTNMPKETVKRDFI